MSSPANPYTNSAVNQADPVKLVEMLYAGAIRFCRMAQRHVAASEIEPAHHAILRCYAIIAELMATLDFEKGGQIAQGLEQCYDFMLSRLKDADMQKQAGPLDEVLSMLVPLHGTWCESFGLSRPLSIQPVAAALPETADTFHGEQAAESQPATPLGGRLNLQG
ncbi:flagellar export chaperone FliS [bacterium]|nr:flagellar export chaperone FliS [bacterium]